jgi:hypothetical protein
LKDNYYNAKSKEIQLSLNKNAYDLLSKFGWDGCFNMLDNQYKRFKNEFTEISIKGSIYHELSHWLNDSLHNKNIEKTLIKRKKEPYKYSNINFHFIEIDAQIHSIKQIKRQSKNWDDITWFDIIQLKPALFIIFNQATINKETYKTYTKNLLKRMVREDLMTKKLSNIPSYDKMKEWLENH